MLMDSRSLNSGNSTLHNGSETAVAPNRLGKLTDGDINLRLDAISLVHDVKAPLRRLIDESLYRYTNGSPFIRN